MLQGLRICCRELAIRNRKRAVNCTERDNYYLSNWPYVGENGQNMEYAALHFIASHLSVFHFFSFFFFFLLFLVIKKHPTLQNLEQKNILLRRAVRLLHSGQRLCFLVLRLSIHCHFPCTQLEPSAPPPCLLKRLLSSADQHEKRK